MDMQVLLVEDSEPDAALITGCLEAAGVSVEWIQTLAEVLDADIGSRFDLVLLDLNLPDSGAMEAIEQVRETGAKLTIICIDTETGVPAVETNGSARAAGYYGANGIVRKSLLMNGHAEAVLHDAVHFASGVKDRSKERKRVLREKYERVRG
jgi:CheY-like chemotaxis protein